MQLIAHTEESTPAADGSNTESVRQVPNDVDVDTLAVAGVQRIELHFPKFTDGRAFSQAVMLRRRLGFQGDIRATGEVLVDQLAQMQRTGFTSAVLAPGQDVATGARLLAHYSGHYQGDALDARPRFARPIAGAGVS